MNFNHNDTTEHRDISLTTETQRTQRVLLFKHRNFGTSEQSFLEELA